MPRVLTTAPAGSPEWLAARAGKIGGTSAAAIVCGAQPDCRTFTTPYQEWARLTWELDHGRPQEREIDPKLRKVLRWGQKSEPLHRELLEEDVPGVSTPAPGVLQHDRFDWLAGSPDGEFRKDGDPRRWGLELKAPTWLTPWLDGFGEEHVPREEWRVGAPIPAQVQAITCCAITGTDGALVSALFDAEPHFHFVERTAMGEEWLLDTLERFWVDNVLARVPPELTRGDYDALRSAYPDSEARTVDLPQGAERWILLLHEATERRRKAEADVDLAKANLLLLLNGASDGRCGRLRVSTWVQGNGRRFEVYGV